MRELPYVKVNPKAERALRAGHPWVYGAEIMETRDCRDGCIADVFSAKEKYLGTGFYNSHSKITVRVFSTNANDTYQEAFFARRLTWAIQYRQRVMGDDFDCCRLIFGDGDMFPGWTVDKFGSVLVSQIQCLGIEQRRELLLPLLVRCLREEGTQVEAVYERADSPVRALEGMEVREQGSFFAGEGLITDRSTAIEIKENGIRYKVDFAEGQKTGFFLDQKYNRLAAARIGKGLRVLDCCTHTGAFALNCARGGAQSVTAVDVSAKAIENARENAVLNGLADKINFVKSDVFQYLDDLADSGRKDFDFIILDPPAFTKNAATVKRAFAGYKEINLKAMRSLPRGGYLATASCSRAMTNQLFTAAVLEAARDANVTLRQVEGRRQAPDHPILPTVPETEYLKFYIYQIV